ncbi:MAG: hypothetical protein IPP12_04460 [Nitrospira sp.]|nr:hypothetical protein [Nitrospira sp.]
MICTKSSLANFHGAMQISFDLSRAHLHGFHAYGKDHGVSFRGGSGSPPMRS